MVSSPFFDILRQTAKNRRWATVISPLGNGKIIVAQRRIHYARAEISRNYLQRFKQWMHISYPFDDIDL